MKLDIKDKKILSELCKNGRLPSTTIAKKVALSREVVEYRIKRLVKQGIIRKFTTVIDVERFGYRPYNVFLLMQNFNETNQKEIIAFLRSNSAIRWLSTCFGKYDLAIRINAKDRDQFNLIFNEITEKLGSNLKSYEVTMSTNKLKSVNPFELFYANQKNQKITDNIDVNNVTTTDKDLEILKEISVDCRISLIELSKKIKLTPEAIKYRIKRLETKGIIKGYSCQVDIFKLNYSWYTLLLSLKPIDKKFESTLTTLFSMNKKVWFADKNIGKWNILLEIVAEDAKDFHKTLLELRNKLGEKLNSFELLMIFQEHVNRSYPEFIHQELLKKLQ